MNKNLVRRSQFQVLALTAAFDLLIEGDEAFITQLTSTSAAKVQRQREKDLAVVLNANAGFSGGASHIAGTLDISYGRVAIDAPLDVNGKLSNKLVTTAANDYSQADRERNHAIGIKEIITISPVTAGQETKVLIEVVHYVPAPEIAA